MYRNAILGTAAALGMLVLILDAKTALTGAQEGLNLCLQTVIPALFPFFILSILLTSVLTGIRSKKLKPLGKLCRIPHGSECILITGLLGGYPVGAQAVAQAWQNGYLTKENAIRMLGFCSNAGPSFLFGILSPVFPDWRAVWALWGIQIFSALLTGMLLPGGSANTVSPCKAEKMSIPSAVEQSLRITMKVCGWVIVFRVILAFLNRWLFWAFPTWIRVVISGILELTNGCCQLSSVSDPALRYLLCGGMLSFGGLCVYTQTVSAVGKLGIGMYLTGKIMQCVLSLLLAAATAPLLFGGSAVIPMVIAALLIVGCAATVLGSKKKITVAIS